MGQSGCYGDVGAVLVEDGARAVDDFLVALDLCYDLLLHVQRWQGDLKRGILLCVDVGQRSRLGIAENPFLPMNRIE